MSGTLILGYDVETASESTAGFLRGARALHERFSAPWTIYLTGQTLERRLRDVQEVASDPLLTIAQHTYSHILLRSVHMRPGDGKPIHGEESEFHKQGASLPQIRDELEKTQALMRDLLGLECRGLTGPWAYHQGLAPRPDILQVVYESGIRWVRTNGRDSRGCNPTPFSEQPFFYDEQGYPDILELGVQGYQDDFYWERFDDRRHGSTYPDYLLATLEEVSRHDWVWNVCSHDHGTPTKEAFDATKAVWLGPLIARAKELGIRMVSPEELYSEMHAPLARHTG